MRSLALLLAVAFLAACGSAETTVVIRPLLRPAHASFCSSPQGSLAKTPCRSPDGKWTIELGSGPGAQLILTRVSTGKRTEVYSSGDSCCDDIAWARPHDLFFTDDSRTFTLDPVRPRPRFLAAFSDFYVSPDGAWIAGYDSVPPGEPQFAALVDVANGSCVLFPGRRNYIGWKYRLYTRAPTTGFIRHRYVVVAKSSGRAVRYRIASLHDPCPTE